MRFTLSAVKAKNEIREIKGLMKTFPTAGPSTFVSAQSKVAALVPEGAPDKLRTWYKSKISFRENHNAEW